MRFARHATAIKREPAAPLRPESVDERGARKDPIESVARASVVIKDDLDPVIATANEPITTSLAQ